jgi:glutamine synthetase
MKGMLTVDQLRDLVAKGDIDTVVAGFTDHYGRLIGKRFDAGMFVEDIVKHGGHACDYLLTVDMEMEPVPGYKFANWELGYGDFHMVPDLATMRVASWLDRTAFVLCDLKSEKTHALVEVAPRSILRRQIAALHELNYQSFAATELEHYLFRTSYRDAAKSGFRDLEPAGWYLEDYHLLQGTRTEDFHGAARRHLSASGIPVETSKGEWGKGQHEINVRYAEVLDMADRHVVFKQCLKELADAAGVSVTFMAKPFQGQAGSSCHMHFSLWRGGKNVFKKDGDLFRWFLGGWMAHVPELMVFYAPTVNSYKRYVDASWAPTRIAWSYDNRTAGFRVVGDGSSLRIECRIPGADCNPYLTLAATIAAGLAGIESGADPGPVFTGNAYEATDVDRVPWNIVDAINALEASDVAVQAFGADVHHHLVNTAKQEWLAFGQVVTDWERRRCFEQF